MAVQRTRGLFAIAELLDMVIYKQL